MSHRARPRVLIVEDQYLVAETYRGAVEELGFEVVGPSPSVVGALRLLEDEAVDAALLDVVLNGRVITPVASRLRELGVPFVFLSGAAVQELVPEDFHDVGVLEKPASMRDLTQALQRLLADS